MSEWKISSWLCILDIKNEQSEYSYLMDLLCALEGLASGRFDCQGPELSRFQPCLRGTLRSGGPWELELV